MSDVIKELDDVLSLLKNGGYEIKGNVKKLRDDISNLENTIEKNQETAFSEIKEELNGLKKIVSDTNIKIDNMRENEEKEKTEMKIGYYSTLVNMKNEIMNFDINNIDSLIDAFDSYNNEKKSIFEELHGIVEKTIEKNNSAYNSLYDLIMINLSDYEEILIKHQNRLSSFFSSIKEKILTLSNLFLMIYDDYQIEVSKINQEYKERKETLLKTHPEFSYAFDDGGVNLSEKEKANFDNLYDVLYSEYTNKQEKNFADFKKESDSLLKRMENILSSLLVEDSSLFNKRREIIEEIKMNILDDKENNALLISKLEHITDKKELEDVITYAFKKMKKERYDYYCNKERELEKDFLKKRQSLYENNLLVRYLASEHKESAYLEGEIFENKVYQEIDSLFLTIMDKKLDAAFELMIKEEKILNAFLKLKLRYDFEKDYISLSLRFEINNQLSGLKRQIKTISAQNEYETSIYKNVYAKIEKEDKKSLALLDYEINISKLHRDFITAKGIVKIGYELFKQERNLDLLKPRYALEKIISEYDVAKKGFETVYNSELSFLNQSRTRDEVMNLSNYKYSLSLLKHRSMVASQMIDLAKSEYSLRVNVLNDIKNTSASYSSHQIDRMIAGYLDQVKQMEEIKNINLNSILQKIEFYGQTTKDKDENTKAVNEILDNVKDANDKILSIIKNDPEITKHKENIERMNYVTLEGIDRAQKIKNSSLERAVQSLKTAEEAIEALNKSLDSESSIDYVSAFNEYKLTYINELDRISENLDNESKPLIEELNRIAYYYNSDRYSKEFDDLNEKHQVKLNEYYRNLIDKYEEIDKLYFEDPARIENMNTELSNTLDSFIEYSNHEIEDNKNYMNERIESLRVKFDEAIRDADKALKDKAEIIAKETEDERIKVYDKAKELSISRETLRKTIIKVQKKARKDYGLEFEAFSYDLDKRMKQIEKEMDDKYLNPSVYTLKGE